MNCGCCAKEQQKALKRKHLFKKWPEVTVACTPDNIKWENLGYGAKTRRTRACIVWLIAIVLVLASLIGIVIMKNELNELKEKYNTNIICPDSTTKVEAYFDQQKE